MLNNIFYFCRVCGSWISKLHSLYLNCTWPSVPPGFSEAPSIWWKKVFQISMNPAPKICPLLFCPKPICLDCQMHIFYPLSQTSNRKILDSCYFSGLNPPKRGRGLYVEISPNFFSSHNMSALSVHLCFSAVVFFFFFFIIGWAQHLAFCY